MPSLDVVIESPIRPSFRVAQIQGIFDVPAAQVVRHEFKASLPVEDRPWKLGLVVGPSGSGKTTIGRRAFPGALFHEGYDWPEDAAVVDGFPADLDGREVTQALSSVGFSSPPHWLKRFGHLSNGQQFRCELARLMLEGVDTVVCDEFTSVIDRDAAKVSSAAVAKAIRARPAAPQFVALSCHYDVIDWLDPDWVFDTASMTFAWRSLRRRPPVELCLHESTRAAWPLFKPHHYMSGEINSAARCFVATWNGQPVGFTSWMHFPHAQVKNGKRAHRLVVLPDYQGIGIGNALAAWSGAHLKAAGFRFYLATGHPALIRHCHASKLWKTTRVGHCRDGSGTTRCSRARASSGASNRLTGTFEYIGPALAYSPEGPKNAA